jgi:GNAT superfamily N-acetyltransferase
VRHVRGGTSPGKVFLNENFPAEGSVTVANDRDEEGLPMYHVRPLTLPADYPHLAALFSSDSPEPVSVADLEAGDAKIPEPGLAGYDDQGRLVSHCRDRYVAVDAAGRVAGYGDAWRAPWNPPGEMICSAVVAPALRGQGIGRLLLDRVEQTAREKGAAYIKAQLKDSDASALACLSKRGYTVDRHLFQSKLDLSTFDEAPLLRPLEGVRFFTLADEPGAGTERKLYDLEALTQPDNPSFGGGMWPFEQWRLWVLETPRAVPDCFILAADAAGRTVGTTFMHRLENGAMHTLHTGVVREWRGRGLALALKLQAAAAARRHGAPYMRTDNDSQNGPMLAVNRKLGYEPLPGDYVVIKQLQ